jgi:F-type H+-transporting ATPase subunit epsilon
MSVKCVVVTPETTVLEASADMVVFPAVDGEIGVLPRRMPLVARLGHGELRLTENNAVTRRMFVSGGFAQVRANTVTLMTTIARNAGEIDTQQVEKQLIATINEPAGTPEAVADRANRIAGLKAQLAFAAKK